MSVIGNYLNGMSQVRGIQNHGSVEDLIRSTLGNRFADNPTNPAKKELPPQTPQSPSHIKPVQETVESVNEFLSATQNFTQEKEPPRQERRLTPFQKSLLTSREDDFITPKKQEEETKTYREEYFSEPENDFEEITIKPKPVRRANEYLFHRDTDEVFECKVTVEGGSSDNTSARLILKTDYWNILFDGSIKKNGTCCIPLKKISLFPEGTIGHAYLEIVVDDVVFIPWESPFRISMSKKVSVQTPSLNRR